MRGAIMAASLEDLLPVAVDQRKKIALAEAAKASDAASQLAREEAEKKHYSTGSRSRQALTTRSV